MTKRITLTVAGVAATATAGLAAAAPSGASAQIVELGQTRTPLAAPSCAAGVSPADCYIILTRTTAVQTASDAVLNPTRVRSPGWIVAFTVGLSQLSPSPQTEQSYLHTLDSAHGGPPAVALTVLKPGPRNAYTVEAQSATVQLTPFLGQVLQEPLSLPPAFSSFAALPVAPGDVIGLTVPTWAPVLAYGLPTTAFGYRQSRSARCNSAAGSQTAQTTVGATTRYLCSYTGTRVEYSATEVVDQPYPKTYADGRRRRRT